MDKEKKQEKSKTIDIDKPISEDNDAIASQISSFLKEKHLLSINIMGAPGSGKTTLIEGLLNYVEPGKIAVIQGDLESDVDKQRLEEKKVDVYQINTHSGCHLNAMMINRALMEMNIDGKLDEKEFLIIENVGNLVCPAGIDIGQEFDIVVTAVTEGSDKPRKYPIIFKDADLVVINKVDLLKVLDFDMKEYTDDIERINKKLRIVETSKKDTSTFREIYTIIKHERDHLIEKKNKQY